MKLFRWLTDRFTVRGRALGMLANGIKCAKNNEPKQAIEHYATVIGDRGSPEDVKAMALFNRALVFAASDNEKKAGLDLHLVLGMAGAPATIKKAAREKLVRIQRKNPDE